MALLIFNTLLHSPAPALRLGLTIDSYCALPQSFTLDRIGSDLGLAAAAVQRSLGATLGSTGVAGVAAAIGMLGITLLWQFRSSLARDITWARLRKRSATTKSSIAAAMHEQALVDELVAALALIRKHLRTNQGYTKSLFESRISLSQAKQPEQVRLIVQLLIAENERIVLEAQKLEYGLDQSRQQIEKLKETLAAAEEIGTRDALTSVGNRRQFDEALIAAITAAHSDSSALCLMMADIDHFKAVNDEHGHLAGDDVLKGLAELLTRTVKGRDTVARYGGEEFAVILPQTTIGDAYQVGEQIRTRLEAIQWSLAGKASPTYSVTASFGIAQLRDGDSPMSLIGRADASLYESKRLGRNRVTLDSSTKEYRCNRPFSTSPVQA